MANECFNCTERKVGCHGKCDKYIKFQKERKKIYEDRIKSRVEIDYLCDKHTARLKKARQRGEL